MWRGVRLRCQAPPARRGSREAHEGEQRCGASAKGRPRPPTAPSRSVCGRRRSGSCETRASRCVGSTPRPPAALAARRQAGPCASGRTAPALEPPPQLRHRELPPRRPAPLPIPATPAPPHCALVRNRCGCARHTVGRTWCRPALGRRSASMLRTAGPISAAMARAALRRPLMGKPRAVLIGQCGPGGRGAQGQGGEEGQQEQQPPTFGCGLLCAELDAQRPAPPRRAGEALCKVPTANVSARGTGKRHCGGRVVGHRRCLGADLAQGADPELGCCCGDSLLWTEHGGAKRPSPHRAEVWNSVQP